MTFLPSLSSFQEIKQATLNTSSTKRSSQIFLLTIIFIVLSLKYWLNFYCPRLRAKRRKILYGRRLFSFDTFHFISVLDNSDDGGVVCNNSSDR